MGGVSVNYPIEIVVWEDFTASAHWQTPKEVAASMPAICTTIGFLVHENRNTIKLCNSVIQGEDVVGGESLIIKKNIISRERVEFV